MSDKKYNMLSGKKVQINFRADEGTMEIIEDIANDLGISKSKAIVLAIRQSREAKERDIKDLVSQVKKLKKCLDATVEMMEKVIRND